MSTVNHFHFDIQIGPKQPGLNLDGLKELVEFFADRHDGDGEDGEGGDWNSLLVESLSRAMDDLAQVVSRLEARVDEMGGVCPAGDDSFLDKSHLGQAGPGQVVTPADLKAATERFNQRFGHLKAGEPAEERFGHQAGEPAEETEEPVEE
jgi:hypothetical protein